MKKLIQLFFLLLLFDLSSSAVAQDSSKISDAGKQDSVVRTELMQIKKNLLHLLADNTALLEIHQQNRNGNVYNLGRPVNVFMSASGLQFTCGNNSSATILFNEITDYRFKIYSTESNIMSAVVVKSHSMPAGNIIICAGDNQLPLLRSIRKEFLRLQQLQNELDFKMTALKQKLMGADSLKTQNAVNEEIRKYIIQAETSASLNDYQKAIAINYQIIALNPLAYPNAYFNAAILLAEAGKLNSAICNMKKFLMFHPNEKDAQEAKMKITEWEIIQNN